MKGQIMKKSINLSLVALLFTVTACNNSTCDSDCVEQPDAAPTTQTTKQSVPQQAPVSQTTPTTTTAAQCIAPSTTTTSTTSTTSTTPTTTTTTAAAPTTCTTVVAAPTVPNCTYEGQTNCIVDGVTFKVVKASSIDPWNVRSGVSIAGVVGKLKVNCRNKIKTSFFNYDGDLLSLPTAAPYSTGTMLDEWDTIDDYRAPNEIPNGWNNNMCGGMEIGGNDDNVWRDVTMSGRVASDCTTSPESCTRKDKISGLFWTGVLPAQTWAQAWSNCTNMTYNGVSGWRLPTQKEILEAVAHGAGNTWISSAIAWSGTTVSTNLSSAWTMNMTLGQMYSSAKSGAQVYMCVR